MILRLDNVILTPHTAALTKECVIIMAISAVQRVLNVLDGIIPENITNSEVLENPRWKGYKDKIIN